MRWPLSSSVWDADAGATDAEASRGSTAATGDTLDAGLRPAGEAGFAKAGLQMLAKELSWELGPHGTRVNSVSPGAIDTWSDRSPTPTN